MSDAFDLAGWRAFMPPGVGLDEVVERLAGRPESLSPAATFPRFGAETPVSIPMPTSGPAAEGQSFVRRSFVVPDPPLRIENLPTLVTSEQHLRGLLELGMDRLMSSCGVPTGVLAGSAPASIVVGDDVVPAMANGVWTAAATATTMTAGTVVNAAREFEQRVQGFRGRVINEWGMEHRSQASGGWSSSASAQAVVDRAAEYRSQLMGEWAEFVSDRLFDERDILRAALRDSSMPLPALPGIVVTAVDAAAGPDRSAVAAVTQDNGDPRAADEEAHRLLVDRARDTTRGFWAAYSRHFGRTLTDDEFDFMERLRLDLGAAAEPGHQPVTIPVMLEYLDRYDELQNPMFRVAVSDGQITSVERVVDSGGVETENVSIEFRPNRNGDVFTNESAASLNEALFAALEHDAPGTPAARAADAINEYTRYTRARLGGASGGPADWPMMTPEFESVLVGNREARRAERMRAERDRPPVRLPALVHLVLRRDMRELDMEEVRLWTGSARSDASPEGLAFTRSTSMAPPPLYPGVQKAAWSNDEITARQRHPHQRSDQVENLLARLREILVVRGHDPDLLKFTLNASAPVVNACRVFVFRVLQAQGGDLVEVLCVRILQKINDRGASDWGYQVTDGNPRRVSRPLRPYVSREALFREQQLAARQARQSGQAEADADARRRQQAPRSVQPDTTRPEDFRPGLDL